MVLMEKDIRVKKKNKNGESVFICATILADVEL